MTTVTDFVLLAVALAFLIATCSSLPQPGHIHERYIIHAPIKFKTIHHYKIEKIPIHIKKHIHHHKYLEHHDHPEIHDHDDIHEIPDIHEDFDRKRFDYVEDDHGQSDSYEEGDEDYYR